MSERDEFEAWTRLTDAVPEVGQVVIVKSDRWSIPKVLRYLDKPYPRLSDPDAGRWYWYPERMRWAPVAPQAVPALTDEQIDYIANNEVPGGFVVTPGSALFAFARAVESRILAAPQPSQEQPARQKYQD